MSKRTDKFRPSVIDPTKFSFIGHHYLGHSEAAWEALCGEMQEGAEAMDAHMAAHPNATSAKHKYAGACDCCGAHYLYGAWFHTDAGETIISVGGTCAVKLGMATPEAMKRFREQVNTWKIHNERLDKARAYLGTIDLLPMLALYLDKDCRSREFPEVTLRDMCSKVIGWGNELSDKQQAFARKLLQQIVDRPALAAAKELEEANRKPVPVTDKRITVVGAIISCKYSAGGFEDGKDFFQPEGFKITVETADGWKAWGSLPADLWPAFGYTYTDGKPPVHTSGDDAAQTMKGKRIQFDARVTPSDKDCKFGFFKRPTKGKLLDDSVNSSTQMELIAS